MVQFGPQGMTSFDARLLNLAIHLRYMKTWNYNKTGTVPIGCTIIMIRLAGAEFLLESSDRNLIVKTHYVKQRWLIGNCRASLVVYQQQDTTHVANPFITATASAIWHIMAVFLYVLLLLYLSSILIPQKSAYYLTFPPDT